MFAASSRGRRIPAALHVFVIAMLALTLIGPIITPLIAEAAQSPAQVDDPTAVESEPSTAEQPPPPATDEVEPVAEPTTAPAVQQTDEPLTNPATGPDPETVVDETATVPGVEPENEAPGDEPSTDPTTSPDGADETDPSGEPATEPADEPLVGPGTPTTGDLDPEAETLETAADDDLATTATMRFTNVRTIGPSDCRSESTAFIDLTVENADPTFLGVHIFLLATSNLTNETTIIGTTTVDASLGSGKYFQPISGDFGPNFRNFRVELYLFDGESQERQAQIVPIGANCEQGGPSPEKPPMRFTDVLVSGPETCTATSEVTVALTVNNVDPAAQGVEIRLVATRTALGGPAVFPASTIDSSRGNGRFATLVRGNFTTEFKDWRVEVRLFDGDGATHQQQTFTVNPNCVPSSEPTDPLTPSMRFTNVRMTTPKACNPGSVVFVDLTVEHADPTFRGVEIRLLSNNILTNTVVVHDNTIVEASRGSGKYFQPITGNFAGEFEDFRLELRLVDGDGKNRQVQVVSVDHGCEAEQPLPQPMRFTSVFVIGPDTCTAASSVRVNLSINDVDSTFQGVEIRLLATSTETNELVVLGDPATIEPTRNGSFDRFLPGNFTPEFANWTIDIRLLNGEGAVHQQQSFLVKTTCTPPAEPPPPPPPPMRFSDARAIGPVDCTTESTVFVGLTIQNADPTFRGVQILLMATSVSSNETTLLGSAVVEASRGNGKFIQPVTGDFGVTFTDFRLEMNLLDNAGTNHQTQLVKIQPDCDAEQPTPPPMRFTNVFVIGPDTCASDALFRVVLTVNDVDPTFQGIEIRLLATRTADGRQLILSETGIDPSRGNGPFSSSLRGNFTTEFSNWRVQVILFGESSIAQEQTFPVELGCTPTEPSPPPMEFSDVVITDPDTCTETSSVDVQLTVQNADPFFSGVQVGIVATSVEDNLPRSFAPSIIEASRGNGTFTESIRGNFTAEFTDWRVQLTLFDEDGRSHQQQTIQIQTDCPATPPIDEPTEEPTEQPTEEPTEAPTEEPTEQPTEIATEAPTEAPTEIPTEEPTAEPTDVPTEEPTEVSTEAPTEQPTEIPTEEPTEEPTEAPTEIPTELPTEEPTEVPTEEPTQAVPTEQPTEIPTESPTEEPTEQPTEAPIEEPTEAPTEVPTEEPTEAPIEAPTEEPTEQPTEIPTEEPTEAPIETPTEAPTEEPVEEIPTEEAPIEEPVEDLPATEAPGAIQPVDDVDNLPSSPVAVPFQRLADEVATPEPDDTIQVNALPVAGAGTGHGDRTAILLAAVASSIVLGFISITVRHGGMRGRQVHSPIDPS